MMILNDFLITKHLHLFLKNEKISRQSINKKLKLEIYVQLPSVGINSS